MLDDDFICDPPTLPVVALLCKRYFVYIGIDGLRVPIFDTGVHDGDDDWVEPCESVVREHVDQRANYAIPWAEFVADVSDAPEDLDPCRYVERFVPASRRFFLSEIENK